MFNSTQQLMSSVWLCMPNTWNGSMLMYSYSLSGKADVQLDNFVDCKCFGEDADTKLASIIATWRRGFADISNDAVFSFLQWSGILCLHHLSIFQRHSSHTSQKCQKGAGLVNPGLIFYQYDAVLAVALCLSVSLFPLHASIMSKELNRLSSCLT